MGVPTDPAACNVVPVVPEDPAEENVLNFGRIRVPDTAGITFIPVKFVITAGPIFFPQLELIIWDALTEVVALVRLEIVVVEQDDDVVVLDDIDVVGGGVISFNFIGVPVPSPTITLVVKFPNGC